MWGGEAGKGEAIFSAAVARDYEKIMRVNNGNRVKKMFIVWCTLCNWIYP